MQEISEGQEQVWIPRISQQGKLHSCQNPE